jgi:N-acetylgalactosamine-N,N'-diacetylbacillosaminyl-diphospho-undecaprenol 4-alpha-N-acetylgalactosaminyltransferase
MKKSILIISPALSKGGMERQLSIFLQHFDRKKYDITLVLLRERIEYVIPSDVEIINLNKKGKIDLKFYWRLFKLLKLHKWDTIHSKISGLNEQIMFFCGILIKNNLITEVRSSGKRLYSNYRLMNKLYKLFQKQKSWKIITNSIKAQNEIKSFLGQNILVNTIYNAIDTDKFKQIDIKKDDDKFFIGFVGRIEPVKNIEIVIEALSKLQHQNIYFEIYGNRENQDYYNKLNLLISRLKLQNKISFHNAVDDIESIYNKFDLFVLPSHHEGTPNVLLEAMACETICLVSQGANSDNYLEDEFVFETNNAESLSIQISNIYLMENSEKLKITKLNREYIIDHFSIKLLIQQYEALLA